MEKFEQFLARRDEGLFDFIRGRGTPAPAATPNPAERKAPPQLPAPPVDLKTALHREFGARPYMVEPHLIDDLANAMQGKGDIRSALNAVSARHGHDTSAAMQQFMRQGRRSMQGQQRADAAEFAAGGGNWR